MNHPVAHRVTLIHDIVFETSTSKLFEISYLTDETIEAEIEVGQTVLLELNQDWFSWDVEKKLEVLIHEFAHINEEEHQFDHGFSFYHRLQRITSLVLESLSKLERIFDTKIDYSKIREYLIESVNKHTIEENMDTRQVQKYLDNKLPNAENNPTIN